MRKIVSQIRPDSETFQANARLNRDLVDALRAHASAAALGGPEESRKRHLVRLWLRDRGRRFYNG